MNFDLNSKTALITGASSGLGRHFAKTLAQAGAAVAVGARRTDRLAELEREIAANGGTCVPLALDVTDAGSVRQAVEQAREALGRVDVLVNNAGVAITRSAERLDEDAWDAVVDTNLKGAWLTAREVARVMIDEGGGSIVNVASILGSRGAGKVSAYAASKGGLLNLTRALAVDWARHGIRVNALAPGYVVTELNREFLESEPGEALRNGVPQRRFGQPADLEAPLLLLCADASQHMTGSVVTVDGGHSAAL